MDKIDTKRLLWRNVQTLMQREWNGEFLGRLARECSIAQATVTRIKQQETSVGLDVIEAIAARFKLQPWQLLSEDLGASLYVIDSMRRIVPVYSGADTIEVPKEPSRKRQAHGT